MIRCLGMREGRPSTTAAVVALARGISTFAPSVPGLARDPMADVLLGGLPGALLRALRRAPAVPGLGDGMTPAEIQKLFDAYLIMEAQQALNLTDQQYPQFLARLKALQDTRRRNQQERIQVMGQLQRLTNPRASARADEAAIKERLSMLQEIESRTAAEVRKAYTALDEVLDVRQQARFRVFEEQVERRKIELLMRARQQNRPQQPRRQPPPQQ